jgi:hypothetical protein
MVSLHFPPTHASDNSPETFESTTLSDNTMLPAPSRASRSAAQARGKTGKPWGRAALPEQAVRKSGHPVRSSGTVADVAVFETESQENTGDSSDAPFSSPAPRLPVAFFIPAGTDARPAAREEKLVNDAQQSFADEMNTELEVAGPEAPEYATRWQKAAADHDEYLRSSLGWERFNELSETALGNVSLERKGE